MCAFCIPEAFAGRVPRAVLLNSPVSLCLYQFALTSRTNETIFHSPYTLPSSVSCKSRVCHSYENLPGCTPTIPIPILAAHHSSLVLNSFPITALRTLLHTAKFNSFLFKRLRTLCAKPPGVGVWAPNEEKERFLTCVRNCEQGGASPATTNEKEMAP